MNEDELPAATVSGIDPDSGEAYTIPAGEKFIGKKGTVIDSAPMLETVGEPSEDEPEPAVITAPVAPVADKPIITAVATGESE